MSIRIPTTRSMCSPACWQVIMRTSAWSVMTTRVSTNSAVQPSRTFWSLKSSSRTRKPSVWNRITARPATFSMPQTRSSATTSAARARSCGPTTVTVQRFVCTARTARRAKPPTSRTPSARAWSRAENGEISPFCTAITSCRITLPPHSSARAFRTACTRAAISSRAPRSRTCSPTCG